MIEARNNKASQGGEQASKGNGNKQKGKFSGQRNSQGQAPKKTTSKKEVSTCKKCGKTHPGNVNKKQMFVTFVARKGTMQDIAIRGRIRKEK